ncbi:MAG: 3-deoxy-manno-octulosonate cytidylyltransferase [Bacteroidia bacterium]
MKVAGIIPARLGSSRLASKPLQMLGGKPLIVRVYENAKQFGLNELIVATDHVDIVHAVESVGGKALLTPSELPSGTYRCAYLAPNINADVIINIQGDEPFLLTEQVNSLVNAFKTQTTEIATLCYELKKAEYLNNPATVKVVKDINNNALYFSRSPIPYVRNSDQNDWINQHTFYKHIGVYAFRKNVLLKLAGYKQGVLEKAESLEQLTWLEHMHKIKLVETQHQCLSIDTQEDLNKAQAFYR